MKQILTTFLILLIVSSALASESAHGGGIPTKTIFFQALNLAILFGGIVYLTKNTIINLFKTRREEFVHAAEKSQQARLNAEKQLAEIKEKLNQLEASSVNTIKETKVNAEELKQQIISDAQTISKRIKDESELSIRVELNKAQGALREMLVLESIAAARLVLAKDIGNNDHQKLQTDFVRNIEAVSK